MQVVLTSNPESTCYLFECKEMKDDKIYFSRIYIVLKVLKMVIRLVVKGLIIIIMTYELK